MYLLFDHPWDTQHWYSLIFDSDHMIAYFV